MLPGCRPILRPCPEAYTADEEDLPWLTPKMRLTFCSLSAPAAFWPEISETKKVWRNYDRIQL